jgi:hypothetical protein
MSALPKPQKNIRRFRIVAKDVDRVIKHIKLHGKVTKNDRITRPLKKKKRDGTLDEEIPWSQSAPLMGSWQQKDLKSGPKGKLVLYAKENGDWKRIVPEEEIQEYVRAEMLSPESRMPLSRDNAHHYLMKHTVGISRRAAYKFLEKQSVLQVTKNIPNERVKGGIHLTKRGYCEMDLIEGSGRDTYKYLGAMDNWYWLALIENLTGYGVVALVPSKTPKDVADGLRELLATLEHKLKAKVHTIASDHGREFYTKVRELLKRRKIKQKQVPRGSRVEKFNQDFQRTFYRLMRLGRGSFSSLQKQAEEITNNLKSKYTKLSPAEAVERPDEKLVGPYNDGREKGKDYKGRKPKVGDKCRVLVKMRKNIKPILTIAGQARLYKSYQGRHFTKQLHTIARITKKADTSRSDEEKADHVRYVFRYYMKPLGRWVDRDEILLVSGTDAETERQVAARKK